MADVFISYAREDKDRIIPIVKSLRSLGVSVWYDEKDIPAGSEWSEAIETALQEVRAVVVCWSKESVRSKPVRNEALFAQNADKLVPCRIEECKIPYPFQLDQAEIISGWRGEAEHTGWIKIVASIGKLVGRPGLVGLLDARAIDKTAALLKWAQNFADDPSAEDIFSSVRERERNQFNSELRKQREAIARLFKSIENTKESILNDCAQEFDRWIADLRNADYEKRPRPEQALMASTPENPLDIDALRKIVSERDAAESKVRRLETELETAQIYKDGQKITRRWILPLTCGAIIGASIGVAAALKYGGTNIELENSISQLRLESKKNKDSLDRANGYLEEIRKEYDTTKANLKSAQEQLSAAEQRAKSTSSLQAQIKQKSDENNRLRERLVETEEQLSKKDVLVTNLQSSITNFQKSRATSSSASVQSLNVEPPRIDAPTLEMSLIASCSVVIGGKRLIYASPCDYGRSTIGQVKIFSIASPGDNPQRYKATWRVRDNGGTKSAEGVLEGGKLKSRNLGTLYPDPNDKSCWINVDDAIRICATR